MFKSALLSTLLVLSIPALAADPACNATSCNQEAVGFLAAYSSRCSVDLGRSTDAKFTSVSATCLALACTFSTIETFGKFGYLGMDADIDAVQKFRMKSLFTHLAQPCKL